MSCFYPKGTVRRCAVASVYVTTVPCGRQPAVFVWNVTDEITYLAKRLGYLRRKDGFSNWQDDVAQASAGRFVASANESSLVSGFSALMMTHRCQFVMLSRGAGIWEFRFAKSLMILFYTQLRQ